MKLYSLVFNQHHNLNVATTFLSVVEAENLDQAVQIANATFQRDGVNPMLLRLILTHEYQLKDQIVLKTEEPKPSETSQLMKLIIDQRDSELYQKTKSILTVPEQQYVEDRLKTA